MELIIALIISLIIALFLTWLGEYYAPKKGLEARYGKGNPRVKEELKKAHGPGPGIPWDIDKSKSIGWPG